MKGLKVSFKRLHSQFLLVLASLSFSQTAWGLDPKAGGAPAIADYNDSWAAQHPAAIDLWRAGELYQRYERAHGAERRAHLDTFITAINTDLTENRLTPATRRFLVKKAQKARIPAPAVSAGASRTALEADLALIQAYLDTLARSEG